MEKENILKLYLRFEFAKSVIPNGLWFTDGRNWLDNNDKEALALYANYLHKKVFALCMCEGAGNAYHWKAFTGSETDLDNVCCSIVFDKDKLIKRLNCDSRILPLRDMKYVNSWQIQDFHIEDLPYLKRKEYDIEKEIRFIAVCDENFSEDHIVIDSVVDCIQHISIGLCNDSLHKEIVDTFVSLGIDENMIDQNRLDDSVTWRQEINKLIAAHCGMNINS